MFRVYYNKSEDFPWIWSIDEGSQDTEIVVKDFNGKCKFESCFDPSGDNKNSPKAYIKVYSKTLSIIDGVASFW